MDEKKDSAFGRLFDSTEAGHIIKKFLQPKLFKAGEEIIQQNTKTPGLYFIFSGKVQIVAQSLSKEVVISKLSAGSFFGEVSLINGGLATATVTAVTSLKVGLLSREYFLRLCILHPSLGEKIRNSLEQDLCQRVRNIYKDLTGVSYERYLTFSRILTHHNLTRPLLKQKVTEAKFNYIKNLARFPDFLKVFKEVDIHRNKEFLSYTTFLRFSRGSLIYKEGEKELAHYYVLTGAVQNIKKTKNKFIKFSVSGPEQLFGELEFFDQGNRLTSAIAREDTEVLKINLDDFCKLKNKNKILWEEWSDFLMWSLGERLRIAIQVIVWLFSLKEINLKE